MCLWLLPAVFVAAHSASVGESRFDVDVDDASGAHVDITIRLIEPDLKELCDVEFGVVDAQKLRYLEERVSTCVAAGMPQWLRLRSGGSACAVSGGRFARGAGAAVELRAAAQCPPLAGRTLIIDWGLFLSSGFDHQSHATLTFANGQAPVQALLSRRRNKVVVDVDGGVSAVAVVAGVVCAVAVVLVGLGLAVRRARRARRSQHAPQQGSQQAG
jgi:hypothetical protein